MKKFVRFAMFAALVVFAAAAFALAGGKETKTASAAVTEVSSESLLLTALDNVAGGDIIRLTGDITLSDDLTIDNGKSFAVDTNGYKLDFDGNSLTVYGGSTVTFTGCESLKIFT